MRADAQLDLQRNAGGGVRWDAVASLRSRYSPAVVEAGSSQADLLLERSHTTPGALGSYLNISASRLQSHTGTQYLAWGAAGGGAWRSEAVAGCQTRFGLEWQQRSYLDNPVLSGRYTGVSAFWACEQASGLQWLMGLKRGRDSAQEAARPGGDQQQTSLRLAGFVPLSQISSVVPRGGLLLDLEHNQQTDASSYSPILDDGRSRSVSRRAARIEYQHPLSRSAQWVLGAEWVAQTSSLALFGQDSHGVYCGARLSW